MKVHSNQQMQEMLKNGTAKVIDHRYVPYRHLHLLGIESYDHIRNGFVPAVEALEAVEIAEEPFSETAVASEQPPAGLAPGAVTEMLPEAVRDEEPEAAPQITVQAVMPAPVTEETVPVIPLPPVTEEVVGAIPSTPVLEAAVPVIPPESSPEAAVPVIPPAPVPAEIVHAPLFDPASPNTASSFMIRVLQPESAPGGLIAEILMEGDTSNLDLTPLNAHISDIPDPAIPAAGRSAGDQGPEEDPSYPPYISFITFNRLGLTVKNLTNLLDSEEEFELNIIDCNSKDNSWDYIQSLDDRRIKSRIRFDKNCGPIFAVNFALSKRKPYQYFFVIDSDTFIKTKNWISRFMEVFKAFPEVGLLGLMRDNPYPRYLPPIVPRVNGAISYLQLKNADINAQMDFVPGHLQGLRPKLIKEIGYWSEENGFGDAELSPRVVHYTDFTAGFITTVEIDMTQSITCGECLGRNFCTLSRSINDCFSISRLYNKNESFVSKNTWKFMQTNEELREGTRTVYCASIHDPESMRTHKYNTDLAYDNFNHYIINAN